MRSIRSAGARSNCVTCSSAPPGEISANIFPVATISEPSWRPCGLVTRTHAIGQADRRIGVRRNIMDSATLARAAKPAEKPIPFDTARLDDLLEGAGIDLLLVTSKHNVQYLLGGYRFFFFDYMDEEEAIAPEQILHVVL